MEARIGEGHAQGGGLPTWHTLHPRFALLGCTHSGGEGGLQAAGQGGEEGLEMSMESNQRRSRSMRQ